MLIKTERKTAVLVVGTCEYQAVKKGDALTASTMQILDHASTQAGLDVDLVIVSLDPLDAGKNKSKLKMRKIKEERGRVLSEIGEARADLVICLGPVATACVFGKGNRVEAEMLRQEHRIEGLPPVYVTFGLEQLRWKAGVARWLELDFISAARGQTETEWGNYTVLRPGCPEWDDEPRPLKEARAVGFDLETYPGLSPWDDGARIRMAILSDKVGRAWVVLTDGQGRLPDWVAKIAADPGVVKSGSNIKFDYRWMRRFGYSIQGMEDTSTREHIIDGDNPKKDLKSLTFKYVPKLGDYSKGQRDLVRERGGWENVEDEEMLDYAGADGEASVGCWQAQEGHIVDEFGRPWGLFRGLYGVLAEMEHRGMRVDMQELERLDVLYLDKLAQLREGIVDELGPVNLNSPTQLAKALKVAVPGIKLTLREWTKGVSGEDDDANVTKKEVLEREAHRHPIIEKVLEYRKYRTRHSTFIKGVRETHAVLHRSVGAGVRASHHFIHTRYRTDVVETYRLSSQAPNGQNLPRPDNDDPVLSIKRYVVSRYEGGTFLEGDQSQIEIRTAAWLSGDENMLAAIRSGDDIHSAMAAIMLDKQVGDVTEAERQLCKARTFLILYGGGAAKLARDLKVSRRAAQRLIDDYFASFPQLKAYIDKVKSRVKIDMSVTTPFGFRRSFIQPERWDSPDGFRIERQAFNTIVQSTAACITYIAMIDVERKVQDAGDMKSMMVGQVHDSVLIDVFPGEEERVASMVVGSMESAGRIAAQTYGVDFDVPLKCDVKIGKSWADAHA
jgi:DNA polymerase-1